MKYLLELIAVLKELKKGVQTYAALWTGQPYTPESIQATIDVLDGANNDVSAAETALSKTQTAARQIHKEKEAEAEKIIKMAMGFHADKHEQLIDYGIKLRKAPETKPRPETAITVSLTDDTDGVGFIVSTQVDPVAKNYEWQKGQGANPSDTNTIPEMKFFKYTTKTTFVDDDVAKGVRYFYKVRAVNSAGDGPWSEAVSRVQ